MVDYVYEEGQKVRILENWQNGRITLCVPGSGSGTGWYYVKPDGAKHEIERGPFAAEELEAID